MERLGQNFLVDRGAVRRIVDAVAASPDEPLLEIGPGRGALTRPLLDAVGRLAAVEIDGRLLASLRERFDTQRLRLLHADILRVGFEEILRQLGAPPASRLVVVGNLPYQISKPIAQKLIRERRHVGRAVLMFQREVADRLTAGPGSRRYGPLSVLAGEVYRIRRLFDLPPGAFRPRPKVDSTVTVWQPRDDARLDADREGRLRACLHACFAQRRRTLRNNLRAALPGDGVDAALRLAGVSGDERAEQLTPEQFVRLSDAFPPRS